MDRKLKGLQRYMQQILRNMIDEGLKLYERDEQMQYCPKSFPHVQITSYVAKKETLKCYLAAKQREQLWVARLDIC